MSIHYQQPELLELFFIWPIFVVVLAVLKCKMSLHRFHSAILLSNILYAFLVLTKEQNFLAMIAFFNSMLINPCDN